MPTRISAVGTLVVAVVAAPSSGQVREDLATDYQEARAERMVALEQMSHAIRVAWLAASDAAEEMPADVFAGVMSTAPVLRAAGDSYEAVQGIDFSAFPLDDALFRAHSRFLDAVGDLYQQAFVVHARSTIFAATMAGVIIEAKGRAAEARAAARATERAVVAYLQAEEAAEEAVDEVGRDRR